MIFGDSRAVENQFLVVDEPGSDLGDGLLEVGVDCVAKKCTVLRQDVFS